MDQRRYGEPDSVDDVICKLRQAWWVEPDDLIQEIRTTAWRLKLRSNPDILILEPLARNLRDYLLDQQKVFSRQTSWTEEYSKFQTQFVEHQTSLGLNIIFTPDLLRKADLPLFDRYFLYLYAVAGLNSKQLCALLNCSDAHLERHVARIKENLNGQSDTTRPSR